MAADYFGNYIVGIGGNYGGSGVSEAAAAGRQEVFYTPGDPMGVVSTDRPAIAYNPSGGLYVKTGAGNDMSGWEARLAPGP